MKKIENYHRAVDQLSAAVCAYQAHADDSLYRDGLIQRFEFTVELAWKSMKEYLEDQGLTIALSSPKAILKEAFSAGIINDETVWIDIITARNMTSHLYDEATAIHIANKVCEEYMTAFYQLGRFYGEL